MSALQALLWNQNFQSEQGRGGASTARLGTDGGDPGPAWLREGRRVNLTSFNFGELRVVSEALKAFKSTIVGKEIQICTDNATAVAYLNYQEGTRSKPLLDLEKEILGWVKAG